MPWTWRPIWVATAIDTRDLCLGCSTEAADLPDLLLIITLQHVRQCAGVGATALGIVSRRVGEPLRCGGCIELGRLTPEATRRSWPRSRSLCARSALPAG